MKGKKILSILLCVALLTGCGQGQGESKSGNNETDGKSSNTSAVSVETQPEELEHMEISVACWMDDDDLAGDAVIDLIEEKFNVDFVPMAFTWDDYITKTQLWAATDSLPDMFAADVRNSGDFVAWIEEGIIRSIPSDLSAYPNLEVYNDVATTQECMYKGEQYAIYRSNYETESDLVKDRFVIYRWDLAQAAGIEKEPENWDEFREMLLAIIKADPEGKNIGGMTSQEIGVMADPFLCYSVPRACYNHWVQEDDGTYVPAYFAGENLGDDVLATWQLARDMYVEGTIDQDIALTTLDSSKNKFVNGQSAAFIGTDTTIFSTSTSSIYSMWQELYGSPMEESVKVLDLMPAVDGETYFWEMTMGWSETLFSSHVDDEKMDRILMILDYLASEEGNLLVYYGFEGEDYTVKDGLIERTEKFVDKGISDVYPSTTLFKDFLAWIVLLPDTYIIGQGRVPWYLDFVGSYQAQAEACNMPEYSMEAKQQFMTLGSSFNYVKQDDLLLIMTGTEPVEDMWNELLEGYKQDGLEDVIAQVNAAMQE